MDSQTIAAISTDAFDKMFNDTVSVTELPGIIIPKKEMSELVGRTFLVLDYEQIPDTQFGQMWLMRIVTKEKEAFEVTTSSATIGKVLDSIQLDKFPVKVTLNASKGSKGDYYHFI